MVILPSLPPPTPTVKEAQAEQDKESRAACIEQGGTWDSDRRTCILPEPQQKPLEPRPGETSTGRPGRTTEQIASDLGISIEEVKKLQADKSGFGAPSEREFGAFRDVETGRLSGFTRGGKTFLGASPQETRAALEVEANLQELELKGQAEGVLEKRRRELESKGVEFAGQIGDIPDEAALSQIQSDINERSISHLNALASTTTGLLPDFVQGFGAAAVLTKGKTKGIGPLAVGVGNALVGVFNDYVRDISTQQRDIIETPVRALTEQKGTMQTIISAQNNNPQASQLNLDAFNIVRTQIDMEYEFLKELNDNDLNKFLGENAINQMKEYEVYYSAIGERSRFDFDMAEALANPDPTNTRIPIDIQAILKKKMEARL